MNRRIFVKVFVERVAVFIGVAVGLFIGTILSEGHPFKEAIGKAVIALILGVIVSALIASCTLIFKKKK